ncbi:MAG: HAMP domain-containing histidine kinase [Spirochaetota bacterium]|nr:HAMP domain-containing histidine kinase [Spirochaetota bacterium]
MNSIKVKLIIWIFAFISILLVVLGFFLHIEVKQFVLESVNHTLHSNIQLLKGLLHIEYGGIHFEMNEMIMGEYTIPRSGHYYKIIMDNKVMAHSPSLVDENYNLASGKLISQDDELDKKVYYSIGPANEPIIVVQHDFVFTNKALTIYAAEDLTNSNIIIDKLRNFLLIAIPISIFVTGLGAIKIVKISLKPLGIFSLSIEKINHKNLDERIKKEKQVKEIKSLTQSFNEMLDRLQKAFKVEKQIISDASHEFKTPISVIRMQCEIMLQKERSVSEYIEALNIIKSSADNMKRLTSSLLSLAKLDSGFLTYPSFKSILLNNILDKTVQLLSNYANERNININLNSKSNVKIDCSQDRLTEAFVNIIENAILYNKNGGSVNISTSETKNNVSIHVEDTGIGIKEDSLTRIFDRFYRDSDTINIEGTGLGLSIASAIIESHNGSINVKSELGKGTTFTVNLPIIK